MASWSEMRKAATAFSKRWRNAFDEKSQAQSFLKEFFAVFGIDAVTVATFEHRVKFADGSQGYADCLWPGRILVEMKSRGKDLDAAFAQAMEYVRSLCNVANVKVLPIAKSNSQLNPGEQLETGNIGTGNNGKWQQSAAALPRAIVVSDFARVRFYDLANDCALTEFKLRDLRKYVTLFGFMIGADEGGNVREQDPVNRRAAEKMARLHDAMKAVGYTGHPLEVYLVRLLFCLFAEDTGIFKPEQFSQFVARKTLNDGTDLAPQLALLFQTLNSAARLANLDEAIAAFPYVNGGLFAETLPIAAFSAEMRKALLDCSRLDWSKISPAIFGAMFQGVMDEKARHDIGAHYTSEENILKLIRPLFLDGLRTEFKAIKNGKWKVENVKLKGVHPIFHSPFSIFNSQRAALQAFHEKIASLTFLDPACGCGNFLLIAYRELRRLEMDVLEELYKDDPGQFLDISQLCKVSVSQFYGIEIEPFAAEIAKVALWLMDHLCNMEVADRFGQYFARIPIKDAPHIVCANALRMDWQSLLNANGELKMENGELGDASAIFHSPFSTFNFIFGNPPFNGARTMTAEAKKDLETVFGGMRGCGNLDFVTAWFKKASDYMATGGPQSPAAADARERVPPTRCAFVATNSITQGEQVPLLWKSLNVEIDFAYRTFKWHNEAKGVAAVHCVIIGFHANGQLKMENGELGGPRSILHSPFSILNSSKTIFDANGTGHEAAHISGYLIDAPDTYAESRGDAIIPSPDIGIGYQPIDGGNYLFTPQERADFLAREPAAEPFFRLWFGADEFIKRRERWCLFLRDASPVQLSRMPLCCERIEAVRQFRLASNRPGTRKLAQTPSLLSGENMPSGNFILIPRHSSENREYIPMGFMTPNVIVGDACLIVQDATLYHLGVLMSRMHNAWVRAVCGRLESRYRYSKDVVYNNFIWPTGGSPSPATADARERVPPEVRENIEQAAQGVLDVRKRFMDADPECSLGLLYMPNTMPPDLVKAHAHLDALVDKAYGLSPSATDADRVSLLFKLYAAAVAGKEDGKRR